MIARRTGRVIRCHGEEIVAAIPGVRVGDRVVVRTADVGNVSAEATAVGRGSVHLMPSGPTRGIAVGDRVESDDDAGPSCGFAMLGRALDAFGAPLDGGPPIPNERRHARSHGAPNPRERHPVCVPFATGVSALDGLLTIARGARVGIFGPPGAGKSSLIEAVAAAAESDAVVLALVGERGREAERWIARRDARTTIVCATSDRSPTERVRAADLAMRQGEALRARGLDVLLVVDSVARLAAALRERRTALREPVGRGGFPPGVWSDLATYLERAGPGRTGSITLFATVLSESDDRDPIAEAARSYLDGHIVLSRALADAGRFPAIDVLGSASRTMSDVVDGDHLLDARRIRAALARLEASADARELGVAAPPDEELAAALAAEGEIEKFLRSGRGVPFAESRARARAISGMLAADGRTP